MGRSRARQALADQRVPADSPARMRDALLVLLGVTTGAADATAFERLGHAFASVVTGNLVLLGISAVRADGRLALGGGCALAGYALGVLIASSDRGREAAAGTWPAGTTRALILDLGLLIGFAVLWELAGAHPDRAVQIVLLAIVAAAMGAQTSAVRRMGQFSTTYLTGTLTGLLEALATGGWSDDQTRGLGIVLAVVAGAAAATAVVTYAHPWLPVLPLAPLAAVIIASRRLVEPTGR